MSKNVFYLCALFLPITTPLSAAVPLGHSGSHVEHVPGIGKEHTSSSASGKHLFGSKYPPATQAVMTHSNVKALSNPSFEETYEGDSNLLENFETSQPHL